jgi:hypothetical protein
VDALSRNGDRYSIKTVWNAKKTSTIYPDRTNRDNQLFEFLLIVRLAADWTLESIYQLTWADFITVRSWDSRMNAWYVGCSASNLKRTKQIYFVTRAPVPPEESLNRESSLHDAGTVTMPPPNSPERRIGLTTFIWPTSFRRRNEAPSWRSFVAAATRALSYA